MRTVATLLLACTLSGAAPAPGPRTRPAPAPAAPGPAPGDWSMTWSGTPCAVRLGADWSYSCEFCGVRYYGSWNWCPTRRVFLIHESSDGRNWALYEAPLDAGLKGRTREGFSVELKPAGGPKR